MTEAEWLACADPQRIHDVLTGCHTRTDGSVVPQHIRGILPQQLSERKLRLFVCASCRAVWQLLRDGWSRESVDVAERFADGSATEEELRRADRLATDAWNKLGGAEAESAARLAWYVTGPSPHPAVYNAISARSRFVDSMVLANLLRDIFGNPFHPRPPRQRRAAKPWNEEINRWLAWQDGTVRKLAESIYDERAFESLPILADALEDAGCTDAAVIAHLRSPGPHVRGCWAVDLCLGLS
jgi:hypothetical protein